MGDGECAEGAVWEAANAGAHLGLKNLCAVVDVNGLGQSQETMDGRDAGVFARKFRAFGWDALVVDGHDIDSLLGGLAKSGKRESPRSFWPRRSRGRAYPS